jgi:peptide/nickel transport system substrate-binding protein
MDEAGVLRVAARTNLHFHYKVHDDLGFLLYEPLLRTRPRTGGERPGPATLADLVPRLAEGWDVSGDGHVYTLRLRRGVVSSRGNPLRAEDVKWSWDRALLARRQGRFTARIAPLRDETAVEVLDDHRLRFTLERPNVTFPHFLTSKYIHIYDSAEVRRHATTDDPWAERWLDGNHAGFGPFVVEDWDEARDTVTYAANPRYFEPGRPRVARIRRYGVASAEERVARFRRGEFDIVTSLAGPDFLALAAEPGLRAHRIHGHDPLLLQMNCLRPPFDRVRRAVCHAVPYDHIFDVLWGGLHRRMRSPFVDACAGYTEEFFAYRTDPGRARELMRRAGVQGEVDATLLACPDFSPHIGATAAAIRDALRDIGIRVRIEEVDERRLRTAGFAHDFDLQLDPHIHMVPDDYYISVCDYGDAKWGVENLNRFFDAEVIALQRACLDARSEAERIRFSREMQRRILDGAPQAFLMQLNTLLVARREVAGLSWDANGRIHYHEIAKGSGEAATRR